MSASTWSVSGGSSLSAAPIAASALRSAASSADRSAKLTVGANAGNWPSAVHSASGQPCAPSVVQTEAARLKLTLPWVSARGKVQCRCTPGCSDSALLVKMPGSVFWPSHTASRRLSGSKLCAMSATASPALPTGSANISIGTISAGAAWGLLMTRPPDS